MRDHHRPRRTMIVATGLLMALVLAACGGEDEGAATGPEADATPAQDSADEPAGEGGSDCSPEYEFSTLEEGLLQVAAPEYPPLVFDEGGELDGVDGVLLQRFAEASCLELDFQTLPAAGVIESVSGERADVAAGGWYVTPDREEVVNQSDPVYSDPPVLVAQECASDISQFREESIGTTQGYLWVEDLEAYAGDNVSLYQSPDAVFADVANGRISVGLMAVAEASFRLEQDPDAGLCSELMTPDPAIDASVRPPVTNFPHTKDNTELGDALNEFVGEFRGSGELAELLTRFGIDEEAADPATS